MQVQFNCLIYNQLFVKHYQSLTFKDSLEITVLYQPVILVIKTNIHF